MVAAAHYGHGGNNKPATENFHCHAKERGGRAKPGISDGLNGFCKGFNGMMPCCRAQKSVSDVILGSEI